MANEHPMIEMGRLEPAIFASGVFGEAFNLTKNSLVPLVFSPGDIGLQANFQKLADALENPNKMMEAWWSFIGPSSIGQFSGLNRDNRIFLIARYDVELRNASEAEMINDFDSFGEQVMGKEVSDTEKESGQPVFQCLGSSFQYTGPLRFKKSVFTMRIMEGDIPVDTEIKTLISEIDESAPKKGYRFQRYLVLTAFRGFMRYGNFKKEEDFNPEELRVLGDVSINDAKTQMFFLPGGKGLEIDFSEALYHPSL
jgi:hypothetical protein